MSLEELTWDWRVYPRDTLCKAVVAGDSRGNGLVIYTHGAAILCDIEETVGSSNTQDLMMKNPPQGLSVWEGYLLFDGVDDLQYKGSYRKLTPEEWTCVQAGDSPWPLV